MSSNKITVNEKEFEVDDDTCDLITDLCDDSNDIFNTVEIELSDENFIRLATLAHEEDITLNQLVNNILADQLTILKDNT